MKATALVCDSRSQFSFEPVDLAEPDEEDVVIRTAYSGVSIETACLFVTPAGGYHGVDAAGVKMGETVVVHGARLIGSGLVAVPCLRGCRVVEIDVQHLEIGLYCSRYLRRFAHMGKF